MPAPRQDLSSEELRPSYEPEISVLIVNYRTPDLVLRCVESLRRHAGELPMEVLIADNASGDGSAERFREQLPDCELIEHNKNLGFGAAQNRLFARAKSAQILILNPDTEILPGAIQAMRKALATRPEIAVCGPKTCFVDGRQQASAFPFPSPAREFLNTSVIGAILRRIPVISSWLRLLPAPTQSQKVDYLQGSCLLCRREAFAAVQGFDEDFFLFSEEVDLQRRMASRGLGAFFVAEAEIVHQQGRSMELAPIRNYVQLYRAKRQYFAKHASALGSILVERQWRSFHLSRALLLSAMGRLGSNRAKHKAELHWAAWRFLRGEEEQDA